MTDQHSNVYCLVLLLLRLFVYTQWLWMFSSSQLIGGEWEQVAHSTDITDLRNILASVLQDLASFVPMTSPHNDSVSDTNATTVHQRLWLSAPYIDPSCALVSPFTARQKCEHSAIQTILRQEGAPNSPSVRSAKEAMEIATSVEKYATLLAGADFWKWSMALDPAVVIAQYVAASRTLPSTREEPIDPKHQQQTLTTEHRSGSALPVSCNRRGEPRRNRLVEIGSHKGTSMAFLSLASNAKESISIDPYGMGFADDGRADSEYQSQGVALMKRVKLLCDEGQLRRHYCHRLSHSAQQQQQLAPDVQAGTGFMYAAYALYELLHLDVRHLRMTSDEGLLHLLRHELHASGGADLIYVDGVHVGHTPLKDVVLALLLLRPGGVLVLDDWFAPDVMQVKRQLDSALPLVMESWKTAAYLAYRK